MTTLLISLYNNNKGTEAFLANQQAKFLWTCVQNTA